MKILIVGGGNMGKTYAQSFLSAKIISDEQLVILERSREKAEILHQEGFKNVIHKPDTHTGRADLLVLAVKPQDAQNMFENIKPFISPDQLILSIMAGIKIKTIRKELNAPKIVRAMPNLPAQIGLGMTAYTAAADVSRIELVMVQNLLNTTGKSVYFDDERFIDVSTAVSGSGPAYVFYFMNSMIEAAKELGLKESEAELLVWQTFFGAIDLHNKKDLTCAEWIAKVASRGGTTEAALKEFNVREVDEDIRAGLKAAFNRAVELSLL